MLLEVDSGATLTVISGITVGAGGLLKGTGTIVADIINSDGVVTAGMRESGSGVLLLLGMLGTIWMRPGWSYSQRSGLDAS